MSDTPVAAPAASSASAAEPVQAPETNLETAEASDSEPTPEPKVTPVEAIKQEEKKANIRKLKLKYEGKEEDFDLDMDNNEELVKHLQLSKMSQKKAQESAQLKKEVEQFFSLLKKDPKRVLSDPSLSIDIKKFAEDIINEEIENMQKTPEQKELAKAQKELEDIKAKLKEEQDAKDSAEKARFEEQMAVELDRDIEQALSSNEMPKSPIYVKRMAEYMMLALNNGIDLKPKDVIKLVKKDVDEEIKKFFEASPDEVLEGLVGKDRITKMRKKQIAQAKQSVVTANSVKPTGAADKPKAPVKKDPIQFKDFFKKLGQ